MSLLTTLFGDPTKKILKQYELDLQLIKAKFPSYSSITSLEQIKERTTNLKHQFEEIRESNKDLAPKELNKLLNKTLSEVKIEAMCLHKRASELISNKDFEIVDFDGTTRKITWNLVPYDVQILGALALNAKNIAEMKTGEGKTLVATISAYLNSLIGRPVHIVTVNDYLAHRDSSEMRPLYEALGLSVGCITHNTPQYDKKEIYSKDIVYVTNNELGFDYLRDNMVSSEGEKVLSELSYAIIDEVDSILIDEARTPLIISMQDEEPTSKYIKFATIAKTLKKDIHFKLDEKQKNALLTEEGIQELERYFGVDNIYASGMYNDLHHIENALRATYSYVKDVDYLIREGEVYIIDEHTGRVLSGRRYSDGLHQAIEAKESVEIKRESKTIASITFQNLFRLYPKLSGMTGTAKTEEEEFYKIYGLQVIEIPTNKPIKRLDKNDLLFKNEKGKFNYLVKVIKELHKVGQPLLIGTISVTKSEYLSSLLEKEGVPHEVLNAKQDYREAEIIAKAGHFGSITIATNMAGRGTDIKLDEQSRNLTGEIEVGEEKFQLGGLMILGTEKHETRRIDNQLRGRAGRQGDAGSTQFFISPEDEIMRIFGGDKLSILFNSALLSEHPEDEPIMQSKLLTSKINSVQKQVEGFNFDTRKHILEYDDVLNQQRIIMYNKRNFLLSHTSIHEEILQILTSKIKTIFEEFGAYDISRSEELFEELTSFLVNLLDLKDLEQIKKLENFIKLMIQVDDVKEIEEIYTKHVIEILEVKLKLSNEEQFYQVEKDIYLRAIDLNWMRQIDKMSHLKEEVAFEGYAQKNPLITYKEKSYEMFSEMMKEITESTLKGIFGIRIVAPELTE